MICRHCGAKRAIRPRGLCWGCYYAPGVKALYPPGSANPATAKYLGARFRGGADPPGETPADVDRLVAEQRANLPGWWDEEKCQSRPDGGSR